MTVVLIAFLLVFSIILCLIEIPEMRKRKLQKELKTFSVLLAFGATLAILKSLNVFIPNPSDLIKWVYSPISEVLKGFLK